MNFSIGLNALGYPMVATVDPTFISDEETGAQQVNLCKVIDW